MSWEEEGIYAISFFLESNELITYKDYSNLTTWSVSYNTEEDCDGAGEFDEERWNFAFWRQDEMMIIYFDEPNEVSDELFEWYAEKGVTDFGEDVDVYNENKEYIGEEPAGRYELLQLAASFAERLHREGTRKKALAIAGAFFSYIRLWRVVLLRSGIMLRIVILPAATLCE